MMGNITTSSAGRRIEALLDENSFIEIGALVTKRATDFDLKQKEAPADGVITGYGVIDGNLVYVYSQDATVLNGSVGEMHAKKIKNIYDLALKTGAPVIGLIDSAGLRLQEASDALNGFGEIYRKQTMASGVIPQITAVFGNCGGGLAIIPALTDFTFMEEKSAKLFVNTPNALEGNSEDRCNTANASFQSKEAGLVDGIGSETEILEQIRELIVMLPANNEDNDSYEDCQDNLNRSCIGLESFAGDTAMALKEISDNNIFVELKKEYAKDMVTGFIKLNGVTVGAVANRTLIDNGQGTVEKFEAELSVNGARKAADFINFCDSFEIPVLSLTNVKGYRATMESEKEIARAVAKLTYAFANATVPKVNVIVGQAYGSAYIAMNAKAIGADMTYAWPNAEIGCMDAMNAAKIMYAGQGADVISEKATEYASLQTSAQSAAMRGYVDTIIDARDTRKYVIGAFEMLFTKRESRPRKKHGSV